MAFDLQRSVPVIRLLCRLHVPALMLGMASAAQAPVALAQASGALAQTQPGDKTQSAPVVSTPAAAPSSPAASSQPVAAPRSAPPAVTAQTLTQQIAALPRLDNAGINADERGKQVLAHLNAVMRYYRGEVASTQKVGEPSDVLYGQQAAAQATSIAQYAFQAARNLAALLNKVAPAGAAPQKDDSDNDNPQQPTEAQRVAKFRADAQARLADLTAQDTALDKQILTARAKDLPALRQQDEQLEGQIELQKAILEGLGKVSSLADAQASTGLAGEIDRLLRTAPELATVNAKTVPPPVLESFSASLDSGVSTQATVLFQLLSTRHDIDDRIAETDALRQQAEDMRTPLVKLLRSTLQQGEAAMQGAPDPHATDAQTLLATRKHYDTLTETFRVLSTASLPVTQELVQLDASRANLVSWRAAADAEYSTVLRHLLLRVMTIALALGFILIVGQLWQRLTAKYVHDLRRRRQLMLVRRLVIGFLAGIVVIFGFVTQFSSLATFAGFITAGIAVGLQTILLSVAAYFFIIGRYGVRVGDRITVAGVTGDVIEVGLVRFYMMELTGTGNELHPTGRVAVFANSVLFQAGTPLYKQMPGTEYAWHELTMKLKPETDYRAATEAILHAVNTVYDGYKERIEQQHRQVENWMDTALEAPHIEPRLQLADTGLQYAVLFPVEIKDAATTDEKIVQMLLDDMAKNDDVKNAAASPPTVKAVIKG